MSAARAKVVAVTGASRGIGAATARRLARDGAQVVLGARDEHELERVAASITEAGGAATHLKLDVTEPADLARFVNHAVERFGRLDVLVANAGIAVNGPLASGSLADWDAMIDVNLRGVIHGVAAALPLFQAQGEGHFVTVTSTSAQKWVPGQAVYAATKSAVRALCDVLRQELAPAGLRCTVVSPGFTATDLIASTRDPAERAALEERRDAIAMSPDAVAAAIAFAIEQPAEIDVGEIVVRPTIQP